MNHPTDYETSSSSPKNLRRLRQEKLVAQVTEVLCEILKCDDVKKSEVARRLGKSRTYVKGVLSGERPMTLKMLADFAGALGCRVFVQAWKE